MNWYLSELSADSPAKSQLGVAELKLLASQFCTHLLAAGVLRQLPDPGVPPTTIFRVSFSGIVKRFLATLIHLARLHLLLEPCGSASFSTSNSR